MGRRRGELEGARSRRTDGAVAVAAVLVGVTGCRDPFRTYSDEYGRTIPAERLRQSEILRLDEHATDASPEAVPEARTAPANPFAGRAEIPLTIEQCRAWTLEDNLDLQVAFRDPDLAETVVTEEEARFEALFFARVGGSDADPSQSRTFRDQFVRPFDATPAVRLPLRSGGAATLALPLARTESFGGAVDDPYIGGIDFTISHPLLRGAGRRANTHGIRIAALDSTIARARTKLEVIRQIADADRAYWLLYESIARLAIRQEQFDRATDQLDLAEARFRGHVGPEIEIVRAQAGLSRRRASIIVAQLRVKDSQRELKRVMNHPDLDVDSSTMLQLASEPDPVEYDLSADDLVAAALAQRMELLELELRLAQDLSTIDFEQNQRLPLCTFDYTYRLQGTSHAFGGALDGAIGGDEQGWRLGLSVEVPIGNEAAEARVHRAILRRLQRLSSRAAREQSIKLEVLGALDNLRATWERIRAANQNVRLEARNYRAEQGQFRLGLRNSTEVLDAEDRLAEAKITRIASLVDYEIARVDLAFATGMLLGASRVEW